MKLFGLNINISNNKKRKCKNEDLNEGKTNNINIILGDITKYEGDCIVNAANRSMLGGGGVDGAIHKAAGEKLDTYLYEFMGKRDFKYYNTAEPLLTEGFELPAKYIIHIAGPIYTIEEDELCKKELNNTYENALKLAIAQGYKDIAFPSISTGIYAFPLKDASKIAINVIKKYSKDINISIICFDEATYMAYFNDNI